ncbi:MAG: NADH-quinone oxidoreductase subunit N [Candidatus Acidiferrales bacterium]
MQVPVEQIVNLHRIAPEVILCFFGIVIMLLDPVLGPKRQRALGWVAFIGTLAAIAGVHLMQHATAAGGPTGAYSDVIRADTFSIFFHVVILAAAALCILGSIDYLQEEGIQKCEYYALVLFAAAGMGILAGANELVTAFIGLELSSISSYILAGFRRRSLKSNEASLKYFILGSFATAFFLYGIAMTYGATGTTRINLIGEALTAAVGGGQGVPSLAVLGIAMMFVGLGFKVVAAPFQIYGPDVYEGAPSPVTALLASAPKTATFALMLRVFYVAYGSAQPYWFWAIWGCAILTMFVGNFAALVQTNVKRLLAYSSIAHAGYILVAFAASSEAGVTAVLFYLSAYALMKVGAFLVVTHLGQQDEKHLDINDYAGLGVRQPVLAAVFTLFLLALLGLPATGGFIGKFFAFQSALDNHMVWLVIIAAINSVIGAYYYLRIVIAMYFWEPSKEYTPSKVAPALVFALSLAALGTLYLGILPGRVLDYAHAAAQSLLLR